MAQTETFTLTDLILDLRMELIENLQTPPNSGNERRLNSIWRTCLKIHDVAERRGHRSYVKLMERMIDAIADYETVEHPQTIEWRDILPTPEEIRAAA